MINKNSMKIKNLKNLNNCLSQSNNLGKGLLYWLPPFLFRHALLPTSSQFGSVMVPCGWVAVVVPCGWVEGIATLTSVAGVPLWLSGSIPCQGRWWWVVKKLDTEGYIPIAYSQWSCCHDSVLWVVMAVIQSTVWWHLQANIYLSTKHTWSCRHPLPLHINWSFHLSSVDAPVDVHRRSCSFPLIHPREVLLAWCWVIARPLSSCGIYSLSVPLGVGLTGVGLVHLSLAWQTPTHRGTPVSDMTRSQLQYRMCDHPGWPVTSYEGMSVAIWCTTSWGSSSHLSLIFLFPWKASAFTLRQDHQVSNPLHLSFSCSTISVAGFCHWLGLTFLEGGPQSVLYSSHIFIHTLDRCASLGASALPKWGSKSQLRALAFIQTLDNVDCTHHGRLGGIVGMHYFSQVSWPVSLFVFSQFPVHSHYGLVWPLHQPIHLGVVGMVHNFFLPQRLHTSSMMLVIKLPPWSLRSLAGALEIKM